MQKHYKTTPAQRMASRRYKRRHRAMVNRQNRRTFAKRYIEKDASPAELDDVRHWYLEARHKYSKKSE